MRGNRADRTLAGNLATTLTSPGTMFHPQNIRPAHRRPWPAGATSADRVRLRMPAGSGSRYHLISAGPSLRLPLPLTPRHPHRRGSSGGSALLLPQLLLAGRLASETSLGRRLTLSPARAPQGPRRKCRLAHSLAHDSYFTHAITLAIWLHRGLNQYPVFIHILFRLIAARTAPDIAPRQWEMAWMVLFSDD